MDVQSALQVMGQFYTDPLLQVRALLKIIEMYGYSAELKQITNYSDAYQCVRFYAYVQIAEAVSSIQFQSSTDSKDITDQLNAMFEAEYEFQVDMDIFNYLSDLQAQTCSVILSEGFGLPTLITYNANTSLPAVVVAQNLYQNGARSDEIILRNNQNIIHPLFMPLQLEVLSE